MQTYFKSNFSSTSSISFAASSATIFDAALVQAAQAAQHRREISRCDDVAFTFLTATGGDPFEAERRLDGFIDTLLDGTALALYRYRIVLQKIREGF